MPPLDVGSSIGPISLHNAIEAEPGDSVHTLAQARTSTVILRLDAEHNESVTRFLINSGLAVRSKASASLLSGIALSHATLSNAYLPNADLRYADLSGANLRDADLRKANLRDALSLTDEKIAAAESFEGATMPNGQKYEEWLKSRSPGEDGK
jgi:uncharacterized protein YjbI with pentapeptide repeats